MSDARGTTPDVSQAQGLVLAERLLHAVLSACDPAGAVERSWNAPQWPGRRVRLLAAGKAAHPMARTAFSLLARDGATVTAALVVTTPPAQPIPGAEVLAADHPLPTARNLFASQRVENFIAQTSPGESLLILLSGGASALLTSPADPLTLDDLRETTHALLRAGAPISALNAVRKHTETLKGGRLASLIPAHAHTPVSVLVLSDVLGDRLDVIASGPLAADPTTYAGALAALRRPDIKPTPSLARVIAQLERGAAGLIPETPKPGDPALAAIEHRVIASNEHAAIAARDALLAAGIARVKVVCRVEGEAANVGQSLVRDAAREAAHAPGCSIAVIYAGETTVTVADQPGLGGRNQELALAAALELPRIPHEALVFTLATDGVDGPTDAAGALVTSHTAVHATRLGLDLPRALQNHDSYRALDALNALIRTGPTGTNVNDLAIAIVRG